MSLSLRSILNPIGIADTPGLLTQTPVLRTALITQLTSQRGVSCFAAFPPLFASRCVPLRGAPYNHRCGWRHDLFGGCYPSPCATNLTAAVAASCLRFAYAHWCHGLLRQAGCAALIIGCSDSSLPAAPATRPKAFIAARLLLRSSNSRTSSRSPLRAR